VNEGETIMWVLHLTDTHLRLGSQQHDPPVDVAAATHRFTGCSTIERAERVIDAALARLPPGGRFDLVVHTGDVTESGSEAGCVAGAELLDRVGAPVLVTAGNHDPMEALLATFGPQVADPVGHCDLGRWRVVTFHSAVWGEHNGHVGTGALEAVAEHLDGDRWVVLACHHPLLSPCGDPACVTINAWEMLELLDRYDTVRAVISGHLHHADEIERAGVRHLLSPATALQLRHRHPLSRYNQRSTPGGGRVLHLHDDGTIDSELVWV
jgi:Icc protein